MPQMTDFGWGLLAFVQYRTEEVKGKCGEPENARCNQTYAFGDLLLAAGR